MAEPADRVILLEGHVSVEAALQAGVRDVHEILAVRPGDPRLRRMRALARERDVPIGEVSREEAEALAAGRSHGGVLAHAGARRYLELTDLLAAAGERPLLVMLDGIEDPFNFGAAIRSLEAAGVDGLVVRERSWETAAAILARASAGASERLPTATVPGAAEAGALCRGRGLQVAAATAASDQATSLWEVDLTRPTLILVGGERRGITRSFATEADLRVAIPSGRRDAPPLTAAAAAAVLAFEALRQRRARGTR